MATAGGTSSFDAGVVLAGAGTDPAAREAALITILNQANAIAVEQRVKIAELETVLQQVTQKMDHQDQPRPHRDRDRRTPLSKTRGHDKLPLFGGKREEFTEWATKVLTFMADEPGLRSVMKAAAKQVDPIGDIYIATEQARYPEETRKLVLRATSHLAHHAHNRHRAQGRPQHRR